MCKALDVLPPLIGTPWQRGASGPEAYDCWSFAAHLQSKLKGRTLPLAPVMDLDTTDNRAVIEAIRTSPLQREWMQVETPGHGDLVLMRRHSGASHCGVWIDEDGIDGIVHCARHAGVILQSEAQVRVQYRELEYRRPAPALIEGVSTALLPALNSPLDPGHALVVIVRHPEHPLLGADLITVDPGHTPAELLDAHIDAVGLPRGQCWLFHNDQPLLNHNPITGEDEWLTREVRAGEVLWIAPIPPAGGGDSNVFAAIAAIALTVVAPYLVAGLGVAALGTTAAGLTMAGIVLGGNLLISALVGPGQPSNPDALESPSPTYTLSPPGNQLRPGGQIPWIVGTIRRQPDLLARPYGTFADNEQLFHTLLGVGIGRYRINEIGIGDTPVWTPAGMTGVLDDVEIEVRSPGERITLFPADVQTNVEVGGQILPVAVEPENQPVQTTTIGPYVAVAAGTTTNRIECDFAFARGLFSLNDRGEIKQAAVSWQIDARRIDDDGNPVASWQTFPGIIVRMATTTPQRTTHAFEVVEGRYEVRAIRTNASELEEDRGQDELSWAGLKAYIPGDQTFGDMTAIAIRARATETSSQAQRTWYVDATRILPHWDGTAWVDGPTESIGAAIREAATAEIGLGYAVADIDMNALERLSEAWFARGDVCCLAIDTARSVWDVLEAVAATGRTKPQMIGNHITFMRDEPRPFPAQLVTHADIVRGSLEIVRAHFTREKPNAIRARYWDRTGQPAEVECVPPGVAERRWANVELPGIPDRAQAFREGVTLAAANNLRRTMASFAMLENGRSLRIGELIAISHPRPKYGLPSRVAALDWPVLTLSEPHGAASGDLLQLRLSMNDGGHWGPVLVAANADPFEVTVDADDFELVLAQHQDRHYFADARRWIITEEALEAPDPDAVEVIAGRQVEPTRAVLGPDQGGGLLEAIVMGMRPRPDGTVEVLCAREHAGVHTAETGIVPATPPQSGLSRQSGAPLWVGATAEFAEEFGAHVIKVAGPATPGAVRYVLDISVTGEDWTRGDEAVSPALRALAPTNDTLQLRFAAVGVTRGPWVYQVMDTASPAYAILSPVGLHVTEPPEPDYRWRWDDNRAATAWVGTLISDGVPLRTFEVTSPYYDYSEALQRTDGDVRRTVTLDLQVKRDSTLGAVASVTASNPAPLPPSDLSIVSITATDVTVTATKSGDPSVRGYRAAVTAPSGDPTAPIAFSGTLQGVDPVMTISGLSPSTAYEAHIAAADGTADGIVWSAPLSFTTPAS